MLMTGWSPSRSVVRRFLRGPAWLLAPVAMGATILALASSLPAAAKPLGLPNGLLFNGAVTADTLGPWTDLNVSDNLTPLPPNKRARLSRRNSRLIKIVPAPRRRGLWAFRFTVTPRRQFLEGTTPMERSELEASVAQTGAHAGQNVWYGWATYFPRGFQATPHHYTVIAQAHSTDLTCAPPNLYVAVNTERPRASAPDLDALQLLTFGGPITPGSPAGACSAVQEHHFIFRRYRARQWFRFVMHVMWSSDPNVGYVELWVDGRLAVPLTHTPTLYSSSPDYWKQGLYEFASPNPATDYELGVRVGSSYAAVAY